jgi:hypothetical protein
MDHNGAYRRGRHHSVPARLQNGPRRTVNSRPGNGKNFLIERHAMLAPRSFLRPWPVVEIPCGFRVDDANGKRLGYFYSWDDASEATSSLLTKPGECRRNLPSCRSHGRTKPGRALPQGQEPRSPVERERAKAWSVHALIIAGGTGRSRVRRVEPRRARPPWRVQRCCSRRAPSAGHPFL